MCDKNILIIIDFWSDWCSFRQGGFYLKEDYAKYLQIKKHNCVNIIKFFKSKNLKVIDADYSEKKYEVMKDPILNDIKFDGDIYYNIPKNSNIYLAGSSFDQCVINRKLGYKNIKNSVIIDDCTWYGDNKMVPNDYLIKNINPKRDDNQFKCIDDLLNYEKIFVNINNIKTITSKNLISILN